MAARGKLPQGKAEVAGLEQKKNNDDSVEIPATHLAFRFRRHCHPLHCMPATAVCCGHKNESHPSHNVTAILQKTLHRLLHGSLSNAMNAPKITMSVLEQIASWFPGRIACALPEKQSAS
ncbi:MAG TPA: hypothetical protein PLT23_01795 [Lentisphaeria bacterium]|nr:hypothetical protein [Lentisphaeria bacterium]